MKLDEIAVGMKVVCRKSHADNRELYWAVPEMDKAVGKPMTVQSVDNELVVCEFVTPLKYDDGRWCFLPEWLEPWAGRRNHGEKD
jgi:hypothetical protein